MQIGFIDFVCMPVYEVSVWTAHIPWTDIGTSGGFPSLPYPSLLPSRISAPFQLKKLHLSVVTATSFARQSDNTRQPALIFPTSQPHFWGCAPPPRWAEIYVQCTDPKFHHHMLTRSEVIVLTNKPTNKRTPLKTSNALRYATTLGNNCQKSNITTLHMQSILYDTIRYRTNYINVSSKAEKQLATCLLTFSLHDTVNSNHRTHDCTT